MIKRSKYLILGNLILFLLSLTVCKAQNRAEDLVLWVTQGIGYKVNKKIAFNLQGQLRLAQNISTFSLAFAELSSSYKLLKRFQISMDIRYISKKDNKGKIQGIENYLRFHINILHRHKIDRLYFRYRLRYQNRNNLDKSITDGDQFVQRIRLQARIRYNIKNWKVDPRFSVELFNRFRTGTPSHFDKLRLTLGTSYNLGIWKISFWYGIEPALDGSNPNIDHLLTFKSIYTF